jgi:hypothetical protein
MGKLIQQPHNTEDQRNEINLSLREKRIRMK